MPSLDFHPPVIAHRGAKAIAPENTLVAIRRAQEAGALWVSADVKLTRDGAPILMHDETLNRTTNGKGYLAKTDWADVQNLDAGSWFGKEFAGERVPHLAEFIRFAFGHNLRVNIEMRPCLGRSQATAMVTLIEMAKLWPRDAPPPLISSFDIDALIVAAQLHPEWPRAFLFKTWPDDFRAAVNMINPSMFGAPPDILTPEHIALLRETDLPLLVYGAEEPGRAKEFLQQGFVAMVSGNPRAMLGAL